MTPTQVNIGIKKIKDTEFFVDEAIVLSDPFTANIGFELTTNVNLAEKTIELLLTAFFTVQEHSTLFMKIKTSNVFMVQEVEEFMNTEKKVFNIPDNIMVTLFSLSISHTRALLAKNALGTKFSEIYLPIINPTEILKQIMGIHLSKNGE